MSISRKINGNHRNLSSRPVKRLGQNFLRDERMLRRITDAAGLSGDDIVLEIGAGSGNLTKYLCEKAKFVYAIEKDVRLCRVAEENLKNYKNVEIICDDILNYTLTPKHYTLKIIGNLPYYITTPIIFYLLEQRRYISDIFIMVQKEVAQRIVAGPGGKDYGVLSCSAQFYTKPKILFKIRKYCFRPQPKVDSALVRLKPLEEPAVSVRGEKVFLNLIKAAFSQRRKTLLNSLSGKTGLGLSKQEALKVLDEAGISPKRRAETLSLSEFAKLAPFQNLC